MEQAELQWLSIEQLEPHPQNPRLIVREDVVEGIKIGISEGFHPSNALIVWPQNGHYYVLAGHHRLEAAKRTELSELPCWVRSDLDEENAYMLLVTDNNQGELSPLEKGMHFNKSGYGAREYAKKTGRSHAGIIYESQAGKVVSQLTTSTENLLGKTQHLSHIHSLPEPCWQEAVNMVLKKDWSAKETQEQVKAAKQGENDRQVAALFLGKTSTRELQRIKELKDKIYNSLGYDDLKEAWIDWHTENEPIDVKEVQNKRIELEDIEANRKAEEEEARRQEELAEQEREAQKYPSLVLADPPWKYEFAETDSRQIENQYPSATVEDIIDHRPETQNDCVLLLWATVAKLEEALEVMRGWGFTYKTHAVWDKQKIGMGYWFRGQHELLLVGTKGKISPPEAEHRVSSIFSEERGKHSEKPQCIYEWIENAFPTLKKLEMYCRNPREGWLAWGNETNES